MAESNSSILIVDDDADDRASVERALRSVGGEIHSIKDPHEVIPTVLKTRPDVVILDALLPGLSGFDLCKQIKEHPELKTTQVIILTGVYLRQQYRKEATDQFKADGFLTKPFRPPELQRLIVQLLAKKTRSPQSGFLKRIGLPVSSGSKKKGLWGRLFGKEEPATVRIAPAGREAVEVADPPAAEKAPSTEVAIEKEAPEVLPEPALANESESKSPVAPIPAEEPPPSLSTEPSSEPTPVPPPASPEREVEEKPEVDEKGDESPRAELEPPPGSVPESVPEPEPPTERASSAASEPAETAASTPEELPPSLEETTKPSSEEAERVSAENRPPAVVEAAAAELRHDATEPSEAMEPPRAAVPASEASEPPPMEPAKEPARGEDAVTKAPAPEVVAASEPVPEPEPPAESGPETISYRMPEPVETPAPEPEAGPQTIAYRPPEPVEAIPAAAETSGPEPVGPTEPTENAEPSAAAELDAPAPIETEAVTWILAESRTQELSLDEAAARAASPRRRIEEPTPEPTRVETDVAEASETSERAQSAAPPEAETADRSEAETGAAPEDSPKDGPEASPEAETASEGAATVEPAPAKERGKVSEPQRAPEPEPPAPPEPVASTATAPPAETASPSPAPVVQRPRLRIGDVPIYEEPDFSTELKRELSKCKRVDRPLTLILIRVGDLSQIVELFGKEYREPVLWHVAEQAMACLREVDLVGMMSSRNLVAMTAFASDRYGGGRIVSRMRQALTKRPFRVGEELPPIIPVLEFGMAAFPEDGNEPSTLIDRAEKELSSRD